MKTEDFWCALTLKWRRIGRGRRIGSIELPVKISCEAYDALVFCLTIPETVEVRFRGRHAKKWQQLGKSEKGANRRMEFNRAIPARSMDCLRLEFRSKQDVEGIVQLYWFGLQNRAMLRQAADLAVKYPDDWPGLIKPETDWKDFEPRLGLLFGAADLERLRGKTRLPGWEKLFAHLADRAEKLLSRSPEKEIGEYPPWTVPFFLRESQLGQQPLAYDALTLGFVGIIKQDHRLIRHALRFLMSMLHLRHWFTSDECRVPGSTWDTRAFLEEVHVTTVSLLWDWFDHALTDRARDLLATSLWDKGLATIERDIAKHDYIMHCNQGPWFCRARVLGGLVLEKLWPRTGNYVDRAFADLVGGLGNCVLADGGSDEGPGYLSATLEPTLVGAVAYARARGKPVTELLPPSIQHCGDYFRAMSHTHKIPGFIPAEDCGNNRQLGDGLTILCGLFPNPEVVRMAGAYLTDARTIDDAWYFMGKGVFGFIIGPDNLPAPQPPVLPALLKLPATGLVTSYRSEGPRALRLHIVGSKANPTGHSHPDRGAVLADVDGQPLFVDRGVIRYEDPRCLLLRTTKMHNVLTFGDDAQKPAEIAVIPKAQIEGRHLSVEMNLSTVWRHVASRYVRRLISPSVDSWILQDDVALLQPAVATFHLHSPFPFVRKAESFIVGPPRAQVAIAAKWAVDEMHGEDLMDSNYEPIYHLQLISKLAANHSLATVFSRL